MTRDQLQSELAMLVEKETGRPVSELDERASLREGLGIDSVDLIGLVMQIENHFTITIGNQELWPIQTVHDLLDLLEAKFAAGTPAVSESAS